MLIKSLLLFFGFLVFSGNALAVEKIFRPQGGAGILYFYTDWCEHCQKNKPFFYKLLERNEDLDIQPINAELDKETPAYFKVESVPSMCLVVRKPIKGTGNYSLDYDCKSVDHTNMEYFVRELRKIDF
jgi:thiol-disulfide isomerase/thioredoxin